MSDRNRQEYRPFNFTVPPGTTQLQIHFRFSPGAIKEIRNLLTLSLFDPLGFRGAGHRWQTDQAIHLNAEQATPGFFPGPLYPGEWQAEIDIHEIVSDGDARGWCEYELTVVAEVQGPERSSDGEPPAHPDPRQAVPGAVRIHDKPGWYRGDLHSHSIHCDGGSTVADMVKAAAGRGLDFLALTSHNTLSWLNGDANWPAGLLPVRGMECTTYFGHANVLGIDGWIDWRTPGRGFGTRMLLEQTGQKDALFVINHPCAVGNPFCTGCHWDYIGVDFEQVDCVEVWNGLWRAPGIYNAAALKLWTDLLNEGFRVTAVAGTDNHHAERYVEKGLPFTWVYADGLGEQEVLQALRQGRAFLSCGPQLHFRVHTPSGLKTFLPGDRLPSETSVPFVVEVRELTSPATLWLVSDGAPAGSWDLKPPGGKVVIEQMAPRQWCRWELRAGNDADGDLLALTNPFYREG